MNLKARKAQCARFGLWRGLFGIALDALEKAIDLHVFLVNRSPHAPGHTLPADIGAAFEFRVLSPDEVRGFALDPGIPMTPEFVEESLGRGDYCFGVLQDGRLVAYDWRGLGRPVSLNRDL